MEELKKALTEYTSVLKQSLSDSPWSEDRTMYINHLAEAAFMFAEIEKGNSIEELKNIAISERHSLARDYLHGVAGQAARNAFDSFANLLENYQLGVLEYMPVFSRKDQDAICPTH